MSSFCVLEQKCCPGEDSQLMTEGNPSSWPGLEQKDTLSSNRAA